MSIIQSQKRLLLVGASRGLGYAMAEEFLKREWGVVGTVRGAAEIDDGEVMGRFWQSGTATPFAATGQRYGFFCNGN